MDDYKLKTVSPQTRPANKTSDALAAWTNARRLMTECLQGKPVKGGRLPRPNEIYSPGTLRSIAAEKRC